MIELRRQADIAIVKTNDAKTFVDQKLAKRVGPQDHLYGEAHDEQNRRVILVAKRLIVDRYFVGGDVGQGGP